MGASMSIRVLLTQGDERLLELAAEGHERAFEALIHRYRRPLLAYCRRLLLSGDRAEDALQQALLQAWLAVQHGCLVREPRQWLFRVVRNTALNALRVSSYDYSTLNETLCGADAPEHDLDRRIAVREAFAGLAALPPMQREALLQTAIHGCSHEQAARTLGVSEGALRGLVYRARASIRAATTALTPSPLLTWALGSRGSGTLPAMARLADIGAGGGSVGIGAALVKSGTIVVAAGALAGSLAVVHRRSHHHARRAHSHALLASAAPTSSTALEHGGLASNHLPPTLTQHADTPTQHSANQAFKHRQTPHLGALRIEPPRSRNHDWHRAPHEDRRTNGSEEQPASSSQPSQSAGSSAQAANGPQSAPSGASPNGGHAESQDPVAEAASSKQQPSSSEQRPREGSDESERSGSPDESSSADHTGSSEDSSSSPSSSTPEGSKSWGDCGDCGHSIDSRDAEAHSSSSFSGAGYSHD
jgi:RNA polymerase sigma factor (sigma-70 family)